MKCFLHLVLWTVLAKVHQGGAAAIDTNGENATLTHACYDVEGKLGGDPHSCVCTEQYCQADFCESAGGHWTDGCKSCSCEELEELGPVDLNAKPNHACFDPDGSLGGPAHQCVCDEQYCSEDACVASGGDWTEHCNSCTCEGLGHEEMETKPTYHACYDMQGTIAGTAHSCVCTEEVCTDTLCTDRGGIWTSDCDCSCEALGAAMDDGQQSTNVVDMVISSGRSMQASTMVGVSVVSMAVAVLSN